MTNPFWQPESPFKVGDRVVASGGIDYREKLGGWFLLGEVVMDYLELRSTGEEGCQIKEPDGGLINVPYDHVKRISDLEYIALSVAWKPFPPRSFWFDKNGYYRKTTSGV